MVKVHIYFNFEQFIKSTYQLLPFRFLSTLEKDLMQALDTHATNIDLSFFLWQLEHSMLRLDIVVFILLLVANDEKIWNVLFFLYLKLGKLSLLEDLMKSSDDSAILWLHLGHASSLRIISFTLNFRNCHLSLCIVLHSIVEKIQSIILY